MEKKDSVFEPIATHPVQSVNVAPIGYRGGCRLPQSVTLRAYEVTGGSSIKQYK